ncbi:hypothetical protein [Mesorhizobium xinjiangense]|uniref:hypothetical protein n=1 Tax=Mesorhizobium xinjiangense TaxID=2678685 RepID=UPI001F29D716|nr:hypothetical protein [Mesorhizobium xinjiangense]
MKHPIALIVATLIVIAVLIGVAVWVVTDQGQPAESHKIQTAPPEFDTTGGQEMQPRWNGREGASSGTPNN